MAIYLFAFAYLCFFSIFELMRKEIKPRIAKELAFVFIFFILFYLAGFRYELETDYYAYYREFYDLNSRTMEFSFSLLVRIIKFFTNNYNVFLIVFSILSMGLKYRVFSKFHYCFSLLLIYYVRFFVQFDLNAIRQGLAIVFVFFALNSIKRNDIKTYCIYILIATTIHVSAIILLILPLFRKVKLSWTKVIATICFAILFRLYLLDKIIVIFSRYLPAVFSSQNKLISGLQYVLNNSTEKSFDLLSYIRIILPTICMFYLVKKTENELLFKSYLIGTFINLLFYGMDTISFRLAAYFFSAEILIMGNLYKTVIPKRISSGKVNLAKLASLGLIIFCDMWTFFSLLQTSETLVPFRNFITK